MLYREMESKVKEQGASLEQMKYFVTLESYGVRGDGTTDDTIAINRCIQENPKGFIVGKPNKTYLINGTLLISQEVTIDFNNSEIKLGAKDAKIQATNLESSNKIATIKNVFINGNYIADTGVFITGFRMLELENVTVKNCILQCIRVLRDSVTGRGCFSCNKLYLENDDNESLPLVINSTGIVFDSTDCKVRNVISKNFLTHMAVNSGVNFIDNWHGWNHNSSNAELLNNSKFATISASVIFDNCYSDTLQYAFYCLKDSSYNYVTVNNFNYYINRTQYLETKNEPLVIFNKNCKNVRFTITNGLFDNEWNNYTPINICNESLYVSINQVGLKGFKNQINSRKVKFRSFSLTSPESLSVFSERIFVIENNFVYFNLKASLKRALKENENFNITITDLGIINNYSSNIQNEMPCTCFVRYNEKVHTVNCVYSNNVFYMSIPTQIDGGTLTLIMVSNYNASESTIG